MKFKVVGCSTIEFPKIPQT